MAGGRRREPTKTDTVEVTQSGGVTLGRALDEDGTYTAAAGKPTGGIAMESADEGGYVAVVKMGFIGAIAGGSVGNDTDLEVGTNGKIVPKNTGTTIGVSQETAGGDGDAFDAWINVLDA